jgi:hypothetical protein
MSWQHLLVSMALLDWIYISADMLLCRELVFMLALLRFSGIFIA